MRPVLRPLSVLSALLALAACREEAVTHVRVAKASAAPAEASGPAAAPAGAPGSAAPNDMSQASAVAAGLPPPPRPEASGTLRWTLPAGWTEDKAGGGMRFATLRPPGGGKVEASVVVLPGPAGGELANVNRWRNQLGLPALDEQGLLQARGSVKSAAGPVSLYDFTGEGAKKTRTVAGATAVAGNSWFVKLTGDEERVAAARPAFLELLGSLRLE